MFFLPVRVFLFLRVIWRSILGGGFFILILFPGFSIRVRSGRKLLRRFLRDIFFFGSWGKGHFPLHKLLKLLAVHLLIFHQVICNQIKLIPVFGQDPSGFFVSLVNQLANFLVNFFSDIFRIVPLLSKIAAKKDLSFRLAINDRSKGRCVYETGKTSLHESSISLRI